MTQEIIGEGFIKLSETKLGKVDPSEAEWVRFIHPNELKLKSTTGKLTFVDEFFEETNLALTILPCP